LKHSQPVLITKDNVKELFVALTVNGKLAIEDPVAHMKLCKLARAFSKTVKAMLKYVKQDIDHKTATKGLYNILPNYIYLESAYKQAKLVWEGLRETGGEIAHVRKFWIASRGNRFDRGNRNIRLIPQENHFDVLIKYPWDGSWIKGKAFFSEKYIPLLRELIELADRKQEGYGVVISFRKHPRIHVQVPIQLYLKYLSKPKSRGYNLIAGFDFNSDRINMVVINVKKNIVLTRTIWFEELTRHGIPKDYAKDMRLKKLHELLKVASKIGVDYLIFEDLFHFKKKNFGRNPNINRKIAKFAKKQLLQYAIIMALKHGFKVALVNPANTTRYAKKLKKKLGLDKHTTSAYVLALRFLKTYKCTPISMKTATVS